MGKGKEYYYNHRLVMPISHMDIIPNEPEYEKEARKLLRLGDRVEVVVESCFKQMEGVSYKGRVGTLVEEDSDDWGYRVLFEDAKEAIPYNWFKRYHLKKVKGIKR